MYKTSDIVQALKISRDKPFKVEDVTYAKEHRYSSDSRRELLNMQPTMITILKERNLLRETAAGCELTPLGTEILEKYEKGREEYGSKNVEIVPTMMENGISFKVKVTPKTEPKIKTEDVLATPRASLTIEEFSIKKHILDHVSKKGYSDGKIIRSAKAEDKVLRLKSGIPYNRTTEESRILEEITERIETNIVITNETNMDSKTERRKYEIYDSTKELVATLFSEKTPSKSRGVVKFDKLKPLTIELNLKYPKPEVSIELLDSLINRFYRHNKKI
jgi:hypothetical protein